LLSDNASVVAVGAVNVSKMAISLNKFWLSLTVRLVRALLMMFAAE
jgi:hypothetical protein